MRTMFIILSLMAPAVASAQFGPLVSTPSFMGQSQALSSLALQSLSGLLGTTALPQVAEPAREVTNPLAGSGSALAAPVPATAVNAGTPYRQTLTVQPLPATIGASFEGLGRGTPGFTIQFAPSSTTVAVSSTQVVQTVNAQLAVYNKAGTPLLAGQGFVDGNALWQALPAESRCRQFNSGNPLVRFDRLARRWILTQQAYSPTRENNALCFAVSTTDDALGAYNLYEYSNSYPEINDVPRLGVWHDAFYMTYTVSNGNSAGSSGTHACAFDRAAMLAGTSAAQICFTFLGPSLPADMDGSQLPPVGTPHIVVTATRTQSTVVTLALRKFRPDFTTPALSTLDDGFGGASRSFVGIDLPDTFLPCNGTLVSCVPQPGTAQLLDARFFPQHHRLAYRNFGTHDALLVTQSVDPDGAGPRSAAVRWIEIRNPASATPVVFQNSIFDVDATSRWMSTATFDRLGNIGIAYSASSSAIHPGIRISGRLRGDPRNLLRTEVVAQVGGGSQFTTTPRPMTRWGDYTSMQIDPADDCTFWTSGQYLAADGQFNWSTRILSFRFQNCQ